MRIGFDAKRAFFNHSGLGNYSRTLVSQLCTIFPDNEYFLFSPKENNLFGNFPPTNSNLVTPLKFPFKQFPSIWRSAFMGKDIAKNNIQLFHGLSNELPLDIRKSKALSIVTIHDLIFLRYPGLYKRSDRNIYRNKTIRSCNQADAIIAISEQTKTDIIHFCGTSPEKIHVIYQGCNPLYYEKANGWISTIVRGKYALPPKYLLYVGTIEERKNLLQLVKAKHENNISLPLVVIGRATPYFEKVKEYISQNKIQDIIFLKNISLEDLPSVYQMAEVFIYPSSFEGFGIPILEALNSGVPVIAGRGSSMEEAGGLHSIYVDPSLTDEIAAAINQVVNDPDLRKRMIDEGFKQARLFREDRTATEVMNLYQKLLKDAGRY